MADDMLLDHVANIVTAHVSNNAVAPTDLPVLIRLVHGSLAALGRASPAVVEKPAPAVSIRSSVKPDAIACLECGARLKLLKRHLATDHAMTPAAYRARWDLPANYPMVAPDYAEHRKELALRVGLGRKAATPEQIESVPDTVTDAETGPESGAEPGAEREVSREPAEAATLPHQDIPE